MCPAALILLILVNFRAATSLECYWCSGVGDDRECETRPHAVTTGPGSLQCKTDYCISTKVIDAVSGEVKSFARLCDNVPHGNLCVRDPRLITCYQTCTHHLCNYGNPSPSQLPTQSFSTESLGPPPVGPNPRDILWSSQHYANLLHEHPLKGRDRFYYREVPNRFPGHHFQNSHEEEETRPESPVSQTETESPVLLIETDSPVSEIQTEGPVLLIETESPASEIQTKSPVLLIETESPASEIETDSPILQIQQSTHSPSEGSEERDNMVQRRFLYGDNRRRQGSRDGRYRFPRRHLGDTSYKYPFYNGNEVHFHRRHRYRGAGTKQASLSQQSNRISIDEGSQNANRSDQEQNNRNFARFKIYGLSSIPYSPDMMEDLEEFWERARKRKRESKEVRHSVNAAASVDKNYIATKISPFTERKYMNIGKDMRSGNALSRSNNIDNAQVMTGPPGSGPVVNHNVKNGHAGNRNAYGGHTGNGNAHIGQVENGNLHNGQVVNGKTRNGQDVNGKTRNGQDVNGKTRNDQDVNGKTRNGQDVNGKTRNGQDVNGKTRNGQDVNGKTRNGQDVNGKTRNGQDVNGKTRNGQVVNGNTRNGQVVNGKTRNGQDVNGKTRNGQVVNGKTRNGQIVNGKTRNGQVVNGKTRNGQERGEKTKSDKRVNGNSRNGLKMNKNARQDQMVKEKARNGQVMNKNAQNGQVTNGRRPDSQLVNGNTHNGKVMNGNDFNGRMVKGNSGISQGVRRAMQAETTAKKARGGLYNNPLSDTSGDDKWWENALSKERNGASSLSTFQRKNEYNDFAKLAKETNDNQIGSRLGSGKEIKIKDIAKGSAKKGHNQNNVWRKVISGNYLPSISLDNSLTDKITSKTAVDIKKSGQFRQFYPHNKDTSIVDVVSEGPKVDTWWMDSQSADINKVNHLGYFQPVEPVVVPSKTKSSGRQDNKGNKLKHWLYSPVYKSITEMPLGYVTQGKNMLVPFRIRGLSRKKYSSLPQTLNKNETAFLREKSESKSRRLSNSPFTPGPRKGADTKFHTFRPKQPALEMPIQNTSTFASDERTTVLPRHKVRLEQNRNSRVGLKSENGNKGTKDGFVVPKRKFLRMMKKPTTRKTDLWFDRAGTKETRDEDIQVTNHQHVHEATYSSTTGKSATAKHDHSSGKQRKSYIHGEKSRQTVPKYHGHHYTSYNKNRLEGDSPTRPWYSNVKKTDMKKLVSTAPQSWYLPKYTTVDNEVYIGRIQGNANDRGGVSLSVRSKTSNDHGTLSSKGKYTDKPETVVRSPYSSSFLNGPQTYHPIKGNHKSNAESSSKRRLTTVRNVEETTRKSHRPRKNVRFGIKSTGDLKMSRGKNDQRNKSPKPVLTSSLPRYKHIKIGHKRGDHLGTKNTHNAATLGQTVNEVTLSKTHPRQRTTKLPKHQSSQNGKSLTRQTISKFETAKKPFVSQEKNPSGKIRDKFSYKTNAYTTSGHSIEEKRISTFRKTIKGPKGPLKTTKIVPTIKHTDRKMTSLVRNGKVQNESDKSEGFTTQTRTTKQFSNQPHDHWTMPKAQPASGSKSNPSSNLKNAPKVYHDHFNINRSLASYADGNAFTTQKHSNTSDRISRPETITEQPVKGNGQSQKRKKSLDKNGHQTELSQNLPVKTKHQLKDTGGERDLKKTLPSEISQTSPKSSATSNASGQSTRKPIPAGTPQPQELETSEPSNETMATTKSQGLQARNRDKLLTSVDKTNQLNTSKKILPEKSHRNSEAQRHQNKKRRKYPVPTIYLRQKMSEPKEHDRHQSGSWLFSPDKNEGSEVIDRRPVWVLTALITMFSWLA